MSGASQCCYMRRHLCRWMTCYLYPQGRPNADDWTLCQYGMGTGPPKAARSLRVQSYARAQVFRKACAKALGRGYSMYDLSCFLCLAATRLVKEVAAARRRAVCRGIRGCRASISFRYGTANGRSMSGLGAACWRRSGCMLWRPVGARPQSREWREEMQPT